MARTLAQILDDCLPEVGRSRLSDAFWVAKANFVLDEITTKLEGPFRSVEVMVPLVSGVTMYRIPNEIRRIQRVRYPAGHLGIEMEDPATFAGYSIVGDFFRLSQAPTIDANADLMTIQALADSPSAIQTQMHTIRGSAVGWPDIISRAAFLSHYASDFITITSQEWAFIASVKEATGGYTDIRINGEFKLPALYGSRIDITSNFIIVSGDRRLTHFTSISGESPLPSEFDRALAKGLRFYLELQQDEDGSGPSVGKFYDLFIRDLEEIQADFSRVNGDNYPIRPPNSVTFSGLGRNR